MGNLFGQGRTIAHRDHWLRCRKSGGVYVGRYLSPGEGFAVLKSRLSVASLFFISTVATAAPHGILPGDINRKGDACTDFYDYANGPKTIIRTF